MPPEPKFPSLPFVTRDMLKFEHGTAFDILVEISSSRSVNVQLVGMTREGPFIFDFAHSGDSSFETHTFRIPDIPIMMSVRTTAGLMRKGDTYVKADIRANETVVLHALAGYVTFETAPAWPAVSHESNLPGRMAVDRVLGNDPAAGAQVLDTVPTNEYWIIKAMRLSFTTDANAADRTLHIAFRDDQNNLFFDVASSVVQAASLTRRYIFAPYPSLPIASDDDDIFIPIPGDLPLEGDADILTTVTNFQAGDNIGAITFWREKYIVR